MCCAFCRRSSSPRTTSSRRSTRSAPRSRRSMPRPPTPMLPREDQMTAPRHFLTIEDFTEDQLRGMLALANDLKSRLKKGERPALLRDKMLAMIFERQSTRTRVSFDVGMRQLGGETMFLSGNEMQLGRAETIGDTARVLSRYVDAIMIRTTDHNRMREMAEHATVPV